jgi:chorismate dehydratase
MEPLRISAVSYLNTLPFVYGIKHSGLLSNYDLQLDIPSECARKFINKEVDIALVPVAALAKLDTYNLLNDYCIGASGKVKTVLLLSQVPLNEIKTIHLDYHSLTSVNLVKILSKHHWKINPQWVNLDELTEMNMVKLQSLVAIGDKTFLIDKEFAYVYDLAEEWKNFTQLPFVFACWVAQENVSLEILNTFNAALGWGIQHKLQSIKELFDAQRFPNVDLKEYYEKNIDFIFDEPKHKAFNLFLRYLAE